MTDRSFMASAATARAAATTAPPPPLASAPPPVKHSVQDKLAKKPGKLGMLIFAGVLVGGIIFIGSSIAKDLVSGPHVTGAWPYVLLGIALLVALAFEFVNGFHDTANAVAPVIYTHSMDPQIAVVWAGFWNFTR